MRMVTIKKASGNNKCQNLSGYGETETFVHCWGKCKKVSPYGKQYAGPSKNEKSHSWVLFKRTEKQGLKELFVHPCS